jgi:subtilisin family serine protease
MLKKILLLPAILSLLFNPAPDTNRIKVTSFMAKGAADYKAQYVAGEVVIKPSSPFLHGSKGMPEAAEQEFRETSLRQLAADFQDMVQVIQYHKFTGLYVVKTAAGVDEREVLGQLRRDPRVEAASLNYYAAISTIIPNDPYFKYQYALHNTGQVYFPAYGLSGTSGCDIKAVEGWPWSTGKDEMVVAVLDTGVAAGHVDLDGKVLPGYNFISDSVDTHDDEGHGTYVASILAARSNDAVGMTGVCWYAKILPVKVIDSTGRGDILSIAAGLKYAADQGAGVINMSFGSFYSSFILRDYCQYAFRSGCVLVAAAGNENGAVNFPAAYDDYCLAVGATDARDRRVATDEWQWGSNYGAQLDVVAPGQWVLGALYDPAEPDILDAFGVGYGTSLSTPIVAGAAALLLSSKPFLSNQQVMDLICFTADDINKDQYPGVDDYVGYGRLNLMRLLGPYNLE